MDAIIGSILELLIAAATLGVTGYILTAHLFRPGEIFGTVGEGVNTLTTGEPNVMADPDNLTGLRWVLWKWTYCPKCLSGAMGLLVAALWCLESAHPFVLVALPAWSIFSALAIQKILE